MGKELDKGRGSKVFLEEMYFIIVKNLSLEGFLNVDSYILINANNDLFASFAVFFLHFLSQLLYFLIVEIDVSAFLPNLLFHLQLKHLLL